MKTINYSYRNLSQGNYIEKVGFIGFCLTSNSGFPSLPVPVVDLLDKKTDYEKELDKSRKGDHESTTKAKSIRKEIDLMLKKNGQYINLTANGDEAMLESSGYDLSQEREYKPKDEISTESTSQPGEVKVFIRKVDGAVAYQVMIAVDAIPAPDQEQLWVRQKMTTRTYQLLTNIVPLKKYYLRYCSVSPAGETAWSLPFEFIITK
jgi:hypothetical protein